MEYFDNTRVSYYNKHFLKVFYIKRNVQIMSFSFSMGEMVII